VLGQLTTRSSEWLEHFIDTDPGAVVPFSREMADVASQAFRTFGRGSGHSARLNFGDCLSYAVAAVVRAVVVQGRRFRADRCDGAPSLYPDLSEDG